MFCDPGEGELPSITCIGNELTAYRVVLRMLLPVVLFLSLPTLDAREEAISRALLEDYRKRAAPNPALAQCDVYVRKVAALLPVGVPYQLEVLGLAAQEQPFALPDGHVVVPVKSLLQARDTTAFAKALAHTFGHLVLHHGLVRNAEGISMWTTPHTNALIPLPHQARHKQWEAEADEYATKLMQQVGSLTAVPDTELTQLQDQLKPKRPAPTLRKPQ